MKACRLIKFLRWRRTSDNPCFEMPRALQRRWYTLAFAMIITVALIAPNCHPFRLRPLLLHPFVPSFNAMDRFLLREYLVRAQFRPLFVPGFEIEMKSNVPFGGVTGSRVKCFVRSPPPLPSFATRAFRTVRGVIDTKRSGRATSDFRLSFPTKLRSFPYEGKQAD